MTSTFHWFETDLLAREENMAGLAKFNRGLVSQAEAVGSSHRVILDMDSSESPIYGEQEQSAYNDYFGSVCYLPLVFATYCYFRTASLEIACCRAWCVLRQPTAGTGLKRGSPTQERAAGRKILKNLVRRADPELSHWI